MGAVREAGFASRRGKCGRGGDGDPRSRKMIDLSTSYLGLTLRNPVVASAGPLQKGLEAILEMEAAGAGAVVMHSLFEEQIDVESEELNRWLEHGSESFAESLHFLPDLEN